MTRQDTTPISALAHLACVLVALLLTPSTGSAADGPIRIFVLAGDENVLEQAPITGQDGAATPGTLTEVIARQPRYRLLQGADGKWLTRDDVYLYDAHPVNNNTMAPAAPLAIGAEVRSGKTVSQCIGVETMLGQVLGEAYDEPVMLLRFGTRHPIWFRRGSRDLGHDYRPPSSGGGVDHDGGWDVIHFNFGIHDTGYRNPKNYGEKDSEHFPITIPIDAYEENLRQIVARLKQTGAALIWARITPVHPDTPGWIAADVDRYNAVADAIMRENGVIIEDLNAESRRMGYPKRPDVHSVGSLAPFVTDTIQKAIEARETTTRPLPRVLFIGDSITGSYWPGVQTNLDGKAYVCKNPGNAGHSANGLANLEEWLDLNTYLLNGQEYAELVSSVQYALDHMDQVFPGYAGQPVELSGLVWFQGIKDAESPTNAAAYETNLANLIGDLRQAFKAPELPVVVTGIGFGGEPLKPQVQQVFDAQMAVSNPAKYPVLAPHTASIDSRPSFYPKERSPGGRAQVYCDNAQSFLEIGEAMGKAMLKLRRE